VFLEIDETFKTGRETRTLHPSTLESPARESMWRVAEGYGEGVGPQNKSYEQETREPSSL
jgi:hypothetical protein